jgi:hypothetical protein
MNDLIRLAAGGVLSLELLTRMQGGSFLGAIIDRIRNLGQPRTPVQPPGGRPAGSASSGGTPTTQPGTSQPPAQQAPSGGAPTTGGQLVIEFWSDHFDYPVGTPIHLDGFVYAWDGHVAQRIPDRTIHIVDPDANQAWLEAVTDQDGYYAIEYQGWDIAPWRSYALDVASGAMTGILEFRPHDAPTWAV